MSAVVETEDFENAVLPRTASTGKPPSLFIDMDAFADAQRIAKMLGSSELVPQTFRGEKGFASCMIALEMAQRMGASPLAVMQNIYMVHGKPSWSAQFLIASLNATGRFTPIRYQIDGEDMDRGCVAWVQDLETKERIEGPRVDMAMAKAEGWIDKNGSKWKTMPDLMMRYRAATFLVRLVAPEITMGLMTSEERQDIVLEKDITPAMEPGSGIAALQQMIEEQDGKSEVTADAEPQQAVDLEDVELEAQYGDLMEALRNTEDAKEVEAICNTLDDLAARGLPDTHIKRLRDAGEEAERRIAPL